MTISLFKSAGILKNRFDAVIGNPPWISYSGRHSQRPADKQIKLYKKCFASFKGWPNSVSLFFEMGMNLLSDDGRMGLIAPIALSHQHTYEPIRKVLEKRLYLEETINCNERSFKGVTDPSAIYIFQKRGGQTAEHNVHTQKKAADDKNIIVLSDWKKKRERKNHEILIEKLDSKYPKPPADAFKDIGVHTGNASKELIFNEKPDDDSVAPIYEGKDINPFVLNPPRKWIITKPKLGDDKYYRIRSLSFYRRATILIRQTANYPIAAVHTQSTYFRNSALAHFHPLPGIKSEITACAVLNSWVIRFFFQNMFLDTRQKTFPQIKIHQLRSMPLPVNPVPSNLAIHILRNVRSFVESKTTRKAKSLIDLNCIIALLYNLDEEEFAIIAKDIPEAQTLDVIRHFRLIKENFGHLLR